MDTNMLILACALLLVALACVICFTARPKQNRYTSDYQDTPAPPLEKKRHEFSKIIMEVMLIVWVLASLVSFWVVLFRDQSILMDVLGFIQTTVTVVAGGYYAKSGAENWKKLSTTTVKEDDTNGNQCETNMGLSEE